MALLREQLAELKRSPASKTEAAQKLIARIEERVGRIRADAGRRFALQPGLGRGHDRSRRGARPAGAGLATPRGVSNPLVFYVGQLPEVSRKPMLTATLQVLGQGGVCAPQAAGRRSRAAHHAALHRQRPDRFRRSEPLSFRGPQGPAAGVLRRRRGSVSRSLPTPFPAGFSP